LPSSIIYDVETDDNGIVWIASFGSGICRYDGKTFKVINEDNGLPSDLVRCIAFQDQNSKMYVGAQGALSIITSDSIYNKSKLYHDSIHPNVLFLSVNQNTVQTSSDFGLITLVNDEITRTIKKFQFVSGYHKDANGDEYVATKKGLYIIKPNGDIVDFNEQNHTDIFPITDMKIYRGEIILATPKGIYKIDDKNTIVHITKANGMQEENVRCLLIDKQSTLWIGTTNGLLSTKDLLAFTKYDAKNGIDETDIKCMAVDKHNLLWIGTTSNGLFKMLANDIVKYDLPQNAVAFATNSAKQIFVLTNKAVIYKLNPDSNKFIKTTVVKNKIDGDVRHLHIDKFDNFYITATNKGFIKIDPKGKETVLEKKLKKFDNFPLYSLSYRDKVLLAFKRLVIIYDPIKNTMDTLPSPIKGTYFQNMSLDKNGHVWISSATGVIKYDGNKITQINSNTHKDFPPIVTNYVAADKYNTVWAATDKGLICIEGNELFTNYRKNGFVSNELFGLQIMDTLLFTSCNKGLVQLNIKPSRNYKNKFILINEKFGLLQTDLTNKPIFSDSTHIWIGGINAVFKYTPINYIDTKSGSKLFITDVVKDSISLIFRNTKNYLQNFVDTSKTYELTFKENDFFISYVSINHQRLRDELFIHRLVGLNKSWSVPTSDIKAIYTNLSAGSYVFEVMVFGNPKSKVSLRIHISPPFYKTTWFITLCSVLGLGFMYFIFQARIRSIKSQNILLEYKVNQRTLQLNNKTELLTKSNDELSKKNRLILESIEYAKKIQESILPSQSYLNKQFKDVSTGFIYYPKDIVSGDFFYTYKHGSIDYFAVVDCTGHGVPGALLAFSINSILHGIVENIKEFRTPSSIIKELLEKFKEIYIKDQDVKESFAISMVIYNGGDKNLYISAISQSVLFTHAGSVEELKNTSSFLLHSTDNITDTIKPAQKGDRAFLYSDGYFDQKNGLTAKKMYKSTMIKKIESTLPVSLPEQLSSLANYFVEFKGKHEQIDDVTVFAIEIN
jgi:ligand-binding sensor domain-containing protein/serine phosphatase RsbU (regulator of sigma subunit)